jgi:hypothetical protein
LGFPRLEVSERIRSIGKMSRYTTQVGAASEGDSRNNSAAAHCSVSDGTCRHAIGSDRRLRTAAAGTFVTHSPVISSMHSREPMQIKAQRTEDDSMTSYHKLYAGQHSAACSLATSHNRACPRRIRTALPCWGTSLSSRMLRRSPQCALLAKTNSFPATFILYCSI